MIALEQPFIEKEPTEKAKISNYSLVLNCKPCDMPNNFGDV